MHNFLEAIEKASPFKAYPALKDLMAKRAVELTNAPLEN